VNPSSISWTDYSGGDLNFVAGCTPVSAGCANCYARAIYDRFGKDHSVVETHPDKLARLATMRLGKPVYLNDGRVEYVSHKREGHQPMAFVCDTGDLFHEEVPEEFIVEALDVMYYRRDVTWQLLTKRADRMHEIISLGVGNTNGEWGLGSNIWLGVTVENQRAADERIPLLLDTPAAVRWVSVEPMLAPIDMCKVIMQDGDHLGPTMYNYGCEAGLDWVVCGAESGHHRRPFDVQWALDLYRQCEAAGVPFFGKQSSGLRPGAPLELPGVGVVQQWPREWRAHE
jgi:protein gp37